MRIHRVRMTAWGPFAGTEELDVDAVSSSGLFLVQGPTGSGKTSILDAVCFALFAAVPGARARGRALRSDHAPRDAVPSVSLDFTASGRRLRITRTPEFMRPKKRGDGETKAPATVRLEERREGVWQALSTRNDEAAEVVDDVLGMGLAQFARVVLLPQGDFAAVLTSTVEDRRRLLEKLFDVSAFTGVEGWLAEQRRRSADQVQEGRARVAAATSRLRDILAGLPGDSVEGLSLPDPDDAPQLHLHGAESAVERLSSAMTDAIAGLDVSTTALERAEKARRAGLTARERRQRGARARAEKDRLEQETVLVEDARSRLDAGLRALSVSSEVDAATRAEQEHDAAVARVEGTGAQLASLGLDHGDESDCASTRRTMASHSDPLGDAVRLAREAQDEAGVAERTRAEEDRLDRRLEQARDELARASEHALEAEGALEEARAAATDVEATAADHSGARRMLGLRRRVDELDRAVADVTERHLVAREAVQDAQARRLGLWEARLADMAGELAERLVEGEACQVCGSLRHPEPARRVTGVSPEDLEEADRVVEEVRATATEVSEELSARRAERDARIADLEDEVRTASELAEVVDEALERHEEALRRARTRATAQARLDETRAAQVRLRGEVEDLASQLADCRARRRAVTQRGQACLERVREHLLEHATGCACGARDTAVEDDGVSSPLDVATRVRSHHASALTSVETHLDALRELAAGSQRRQTARTARDRALTAHGFQSPDDVAAVRLTPEERDRLEELVQQHHRRWEVVREVLQDPQVIEALESEPEDLEMLTQAATAARTVMQQAAELKGAVVNAHSQALAARTAIAEACEGLDPAIERHETISRLAETVAGTGADNALRMRLSSFVLAARLERVAELANERLAVMGEGRYQLLHSDDLAARGARSGLSLRVRDEWTGQVREASTLSGGETFMASLALALGLADAVREESGGFDLQTLFVDEGFGSLDDESLEEVMTVLDGLRDGGRAVGVVSHVADMRSRIPNQVVVTKTPAGSAITVPGPTSSSPAA